MKLRVAYKIEWKSLTQPKGNPYSIKTMRRAWARMRRTYRLLVKIGVDSQELLEYQ